MHRILIIGAGQLGSRHLQALSSVANPLTIDVIDPNGDSLAIAKERFEAMPNNHSHSIHTEIPGHLTVDIAIIASGAKVRRKIIEQLLASNSVKYFILEKILFSSREDYEAVGKLLNAHHASAWVNCCMRMMPAYSKIQTIFNNKSIHYSVTGSQYGLITNAIHYLDHAAWLSGCTEFTLNTDFLDVDTQASKRPGYLELSGTLLAQYKNGSLAKLHASKQGSAPVQIEINSDENRFISHEWQQRAWHASASQEWKWEECEAKIPFQSEMTSQVVSDLIKTGQCPLTPFSESAAIHLQLLEPLKLFLQKQGITSEVEYPFT
jgi:predicted dehydrogenase